MKSGPKMVIGAVAIFVLGLGGLTVASSAHERGTGHGGGMGMRNHGGGMGMMGRGGPGKSMAHRMRMLEMLDTNKDGSVGAEEARAAVLEQMKTYDADGDGNLSLDEFKAMWAAEMRRTMVDRFQFHDDDGNGSITTEEMTAPVARMIRMMDRDGDGEISTGDMRHGRGSGQRKHRN